jgi:hypothetical protein
MVFNLAEYNRKKQAKANEPAQPAPTSKKHGNYKGTEHIPLTIFNGWRNRATRDGIPFELTINEIENMFVGQNGSCPVTGRKLTLKTNDWNKVSLDRVNPAGHYRADNVRLVTTIVNLVRNELSDDELREVLKDMQQIDRLRERLKGKPFGTGNWYHRLLWKNWERIFGRDPPK